MELKIGFVGLGNMGYPMVQNFLKQFGSVMVFNRTKEKCLNLEKDGAAVAADLKDLMENCTVIGLSLPAQKKSRRL